MLDDKTRAEFDRKMAEAGEVLPGYHWELYRGYCTKGFSEVQALTLVVAGIAKPESTYPMPGDLVPPEKGD